MRTGGENLGNARCAKTGLRTSYGSSQTCAAGSDNHDIESVIGNRICCAVVGRRFTGRGAILSGHWYAFQAIWNETEILDEAQPQDCVHAGDADGDRKKHVCGERENLGAMTVNIIFDDDLHAELHMKDAGGQEEQD